ARDQVWPFSDLNNRAGNISSFTAGFPGRRPTRAAGVKERFGLCRYRTGVYFLAGRGGLASARTFTPSWENVMTRRFVSLVCGLMLIALGSGVRGDDKPGTAPASAATHPGLERLKKLAGTWVAAGEDGKPTDQVVSVIKVTAAGSAVQETIF